MKNKTMLIIILIGFGVLLSIYIYFDSINLEEEELGLSIYFLQNVTSVKDAVITLDFVGKKMVFEGTVFTEGDGMMLNSNSKGFENRDENCNEYLEIISKDKSSRSRTWHNDLPVSFEGFGEIDHIKMKKTCDFEYELVPNGKFTVHLFGKNQTEQAPLNNIQLITSFDSQKFECRDTCIHANEFSMVDSDDKEGIRTIVLQGNNPNIKSMKFDLRTNDIYSKNIANYLSITMQIGIGIAVSIIVYVFSSEQQKNTDRVITKTNEISADLQRVILEQENLRTQRRQYAQIIFDVYLDSLKWVLESVREEFDEYKQIDHNAHDQNSLDTLWKKSEKEFKYYIGILHNTVLTMTDVLEPVISQEILMLISNLHNPPKNPMSRAHVAFCDSRIVDIEFIKEQISTLKDK